ncbi:MAG TPA: 16S rRNA (guanine(527)-N(7))-methyltransferase RsmG [Steroidobacteraceae bacterium]|nr:16S rRNA (guanine(527)-N(7))-methyltransferase RsmG [Steroidobacteraceae bacterium]
MLTTPQLGEAEWKSRLDDGVHAMGLDLDQSQLDTLWRYAHMLRERNEHVNLTSIVTPEGILTLHMLDSLSVAPHLGDARRIIDVGTGGGFPGIPLAVACPDRDFTLIDGTQKKIRFVAEGIAALDIRNARAFAARAEQFRDQPPFDVVVLRAVGTLAEVLHNTGHLVAPRGRLLAMKGRVPDDELRALPRGWQAQVIRLTVPGLEAERHLVSISRQKPARPQ